MDENTTLINITIDEDLRTLTIPTNGNVFGVVGDISVNRVMFVLPRYFRGFDLTQCVARVNYCNPNGDANYYEADDLAETEGKATFTWLMAPDVTSYIGDVKFSIQLYKKDETGKIIKNFNTKYSTGKVLEGYNVEQSVTPEQQETLVEKLSKEVKDNISESLKTETSEAISAEIEKKKTDALTEMNDKKTSALTEIENKKTAAVNKVNSEQVVTDVSKLKEDLDELEDAVFTEKRNKSQMFNPKAESIGHLYVKSDKSVIESSLCIESWVVPIESGKRYVAYNKHPEVMSDSTYYIQCSSFAEYPAIGSIALHSNPIVKHAYAEIPSDENNRYVLIWLRKQSGIEVTEEQIAYVKENTGLEQIDSGYEYEGLPYSYTVENYLDESDVKALINDNQWKGKTILWMGTSIPEGKDTALDSAGNGKSYPEMVGDQLGANVINIALGSSMIRANTRFGDYTDGYSHNILRAFSATSEEKEYLIANWETIRQKLRDPDTYETLTDANKETCRNSSYEVMLMPYLNGTLPMPDLFVIDHGHNDYKYTLSNGSTDIGIAPTSANIGSNKEVAFDSNMFNGSSYSGLENVYGSLAKMNQQTTFKYSVNRNCYWGAVNFICTLIYKYNPRARIVFVGNIDDKQHEGLCDAQVTIARDWCSPLIRMWEKLGFGMHYIPGTYNYWGGTGLDLSQKAIYCKDGTHPHSDTTGKTMELYADILSDELRHCF